MGPRSTKSNFAKEVSNAAMLAEYLKKKQQIISPGGNCYTATERMLAIRNANARPHDSTGLNGSIPKTLVQNLKSYADDSQNIPEEDLNLILSIIDKELRALQILDMNKFKKACAYGIQKMPMADKLPEEDQREYEEIIQKMTIDIFGYFGESIEE